MAKKQLLLIGWDSADWQLMQPLLRQGKLPALASLLHKGMWGNLATLDPPISPMLWTSIATGKRPFKHGIHGFTELAPDGKNVWPVRGSSRKVQAIWNILNHHNLRTNVVGWWPSHPAEKVTGAMVSNFFPYYGEGETNHNWPVPEGVVFPPDLTDDLKNYRIHPLEMTADILQNFFPNAAYLGGNDQILQSTARILAQASSIHAAATRLMRTTDWDFTAVYYDSLDHFCHLGMKYHPPKLAGIDEAEFRNYHYIVEAAYRFHDMMLDRMMQLAGPDCNIMLVSDHGFVSGDNRKIQLPDEPGSPALEHRHYGVLAASGPEIASGQVYGASLLDITPTILQLFDLPHAADMDGVPLAKMMKKEMLKPLSSFESGERNESSHSGGEMDTVILKQLEALGYLQPTDSNDRAEVQLAENEYYLARSLADGGLTDQGLALMQKLSAAFPEVQRYSNYYASLLLRTGNHEALNVWLQSNSQSAYGNYISGTLLLQQNQPLAAARQFESLHKSSGQKNPVLLLQIARSWLQFGHVEMAEDYAGMCIEADPHLLQAWVLLGDIALENRQSEKALSAYFKSLDFLYYQPEVHYKIGLCFYELGLFTEAVRALEVALMLAPQHAAAREQLISLYGGEAEDPHRLAELAVNQKKFITVVTGFPRSGTSMMMKMLKGGGYELYTDNNRRADEHNPEGYFELEDVKNIATDQSFLENAVGKAIKVVMPLLRFVQPIAPLKVIWMQRDQHEIIRSQQKMKGMPESAPDFRLLSQMNAETELMQAWLNRYPHVSYIKVQYKDVIEQPESEAGRIADFIGNSPDVKGMIQAVKPELYRSGFPGM